LLSVYVNLFIVLFSELVFTSDQSLDDNPVDEFLTNVNGGEIEPDQQFAAEVLEEGVHFFDEEEKIENCSNRPTNKRKKNSACSRQKWSAEEEKELKSIYSKYFKKKVRPTPKNVQEGIRKSLLQNGLIFKRGKAQ